MNRKHITEQSDFDQFGPPSNCCGAPVLYKLAPDTDYVIFNQTCTECDKPCNIGRVVTPVEVPKDTNRIVIAAIKKNGIVFTGLRHGFIIRDMVSTGFLKDPNKDKVLNEEQGFVDSNNIFLTREGARGIAIIAGQIKPNHGMLYSEDLW